MTILFHRSKGLPPNKTLNTAHKTKINHATSSKSQAAKEVFAATKDECGKASMKSTKKIFKRGITKGVSKPIQSSSSTTMMTYEETSIISRQINAKPISKDVVKNRGISQSLTVPSSLQTMNERKGRKTSSRKHAESRNDIVKINRKGIRSQAAQRQSAPTSFPSATEVLETTKEIVRKKSTNSFSETNHTEPKISKLGLKELSLKNKSVENKLVQILEKLSTDNTSVDAFDEQNSKPKFRTETAKQEDQPTLMNEDDCCLPSWECYKILGDAYMVSNNWETALELYIDARDSLMHDLFQDEALLKQTEAMKLVEMSWKESELLLGIGVVYFNRAISIASNLRNEEKSIQNEKQDSESTKHNQKQSKTTLKETTMLSTKLTDTLSESIRLLNESHRIKTQINIFFRGVQPHQTDFLEHSTSMDVDDIDLGQKSSLSDDNSVFDDDYHTHLLRLDLSMSRIHYFMGRAYFALNQLDKSWTEYMSGLKVHQNIQKALNKQHKEGNVEIKKHFSWENMHGKSALYIAIGDFQRISKNMIKACSWYEEAKLFLSSISHNDCAVIGTYIYFEKDVFELSFEVCLKLATMKTKKGVWSSALKYVTEANDLLGHEVESNHNRDSNMEDLDTMISRKYIQSLRRSKVDLNQNLHGIYLLFMKIHNSSENKDESSEAFEKAQQVKRSISHSVDDCASDNESNHEVDKIKLASIIVYFGLYQESLSEYSFALRCHKLAHETVSEDSPKSVPFLASSVEEEPTFTLLQFEARILNTIGKIYAKIESASLSESYFRQALSTHIHSEELRLSGNGGVLTINCEDSMLDDTEMNILLRDAAALKDLAQVLSNFIVRMKSNLNLIHDETTSNQNMCIYSIKLFKERLSEIDSNTAAYLCFMLAITFWKFRDDYFTSILLIKESFCFIGGQSGIRGIFDHTSKTKFFECSNGDIHKVKGDIQCEAGEYHNAILSYTSSIVYFMKVLRGVPGEASL